MRNLSSLCALTTLIAVCIISTNAQNLTKPLISGPAGIRVNSFTGNMFYQRSDLFIPGRGLSLDINIHVQQRRERQRLGVR